MSHTNVKNVIKGLGGDPIWFFAVVGTHTKLNFHFDKYIANL